MFEDQKRPNGLSTQCLLFPDSDHTADIGGGPFRARGGLMQRNIIRSLRPGASAEPGGMETLSAGDAADGGKRHVGHPGPKPVQVKRMQSW